MKTSFKYFLYVRKSTDEKDRQVMSLDSQMNELRNFAKREGILIYETIEESRTAKEPGRPLFNSMLDRIDKGEANGILCWDIDRLYRNPIDEGRTRWMLQRGVLKSIRTTTRQFYPEDAGLLMGVEGGRATDYIIRLAKNVRRGIQEKLRRGEWPGGRKPLGYIYDDRLRNIVPDPKEAPLVKKVFELFAEGRHGLNAIAQILFDHGHTSRSGKLWSKWGVWHLLTNRIFIGIMDWNGETFEGKYQTFITPELFQRVQRMLKVRSKPRRRRKSHRFPFCGVFRCTCGSMMSAQWGKGNGGLYRYYRCTRFHRHCKEPYVQEETVRKQVMAGLLPIALTQDQARIIAAIIDAEAEKDSLSSEAAVAALQERTIVLQDKLKRLARSYVDEIVDEESYQATKSELILEKTALKREKERHQKTRASYWIEPAKGVVNTLETLGKTETANSLEEISKILLKTVTNRQIAGKKVTFSMAEPYGFLQCSRASGALPPFTLSPSHCDEFSERQKWCAL